MSEQMRFAIVVIIGSLAVWVALWVGVCVLIATARKTDVSMAFLWGFLLGPIGAFIVAVSRSGLRECPECLKSVPKKVRKCPHCQSKLRPLRDDEDDD